MHRPRRALECDAVFMLLFEIRQYATVNWRHDDAQRVERVWIPEHANRVFPLLIAIAFPLEAVHSAISFNCLFKHNSISLLIFAPRRRRERPEYSIFLRSCYTINDSTSFYKLVKFSSFFPRNRIAYILSWRQKERQRERERANLVMTRVTSQFATPMRFHAENRREIRVHRYDKSIWMPQWSQTW